MEENGCAYLSNRGEYTTFSYGEKTLTFLTSKDLDCYIEIKEWDKGYLVVTARYKSRAEEEDYIDLVPILENLYMNVEEFLRPIKRVEVLDAG